MSESPTTPKINKYSDSLFLNSSIGILSLISVIYTMCYFDLSEPFQIVTFTFPALISIFSNVDILKSCKDYSKKLGIGIGVVSVLITLMAVFLLVLSLLLNTGVCVVTSLKELELNNIIVFNANFRGISDALIERGIYFEAMWFLYAYPIVFFFQLVSNVLRAFAKKK